MTRPWSRSWPPPAPWCSARPTWTNSPWGRATRPASTARSRIPGTRPACPAAPRAARPPPSPPGSAPVATGTDTGGSIRQPAALCGITGIKPTYGRCSRWGMIAFASSLDQAGVMARSAADAAFILDEMAGFDPRDSTSADVPVPDYVDALDDDIKGLRIGLPKEYFGAGLDSRVAAVIQDAIKEYERARRRDPRDQPAQQPALGARLLRRRPGRVLVQPRALRWGPLRPSLREPAGIWRISTSAAAPRASAPRFSAAS